MRQQIGQKNFYKTEINGGVMYTSYNTPVLLITDNGDIFIDNYDYSITTSKHIYTIVGVSKAERNNNIKDTNNTKWKYLSSQNILKLAIKLNGGYIW